MSTRRAKTTVRVREVYRMLVAGAPYAAIVEHCRTKFGLSSSRSADALIARAEEMLEKESAKVAPVELGKALARYEAQYLKADARKDHRGAATIVDKIVALLGLAAPQKTEITLNDVSLSELDAEIARLEAKLADDEGGDAAHDG